MFWYRSHDGIDAHKVGTLLVNHRIAEGVHTKFWLVYCKEYYMIDLPLQNFQIKQLNK